jgi:hypothetical protein
MKYLIVTLLFLCSCNPFAVDPHTVYIIEQGQHYANNTKNKVSPKYNEGVHFITVFNISNIYDNGSDDINKLYGITSSKIHENSARFGWRCKGDIIEIFAYYYIDGVRYFEKMGETEIKKRNEFLVDVSGNNYYFRFNDVEKVIVNTKNISAFRSFPYFGGDLPAPHRMTILIVEL